MQYRPLGKTGLQVSALAMGCMRLPEDDPELAAQVVDQAIAAGVNYFETARIYANGNCQQLTAGGLKGRSRGLIVSGKAAVREDTTEKSFREEIDLQMQILGVDYLEFFQVGWLALEKMPFLTKKGGALDALNKARSEGIIGHIGFTGHDTPENFIRCIETGLFDSITVPYNLLNRMYEPTIQRAGELGVGVVAMCPVAGGILSFESDQLKKALKMDLPTTAMALRFVLSNPNVSTACSGMNQTEQLDQNVRTVKELDPSSDNFEVMCEGLDRLRAKLGDRFCTLCRYCAPCPQGVNIPGYMDIYRHWKCFGLETWAQNAIKAVPEAQSAVNCDECGACEDKCPNTLEIREKLKELLAHAGLTKPE
jgi:uncharacterized protein